MPPSERRVRWTRWGAALAAAAIVVLGGRPAAAHAVGLSRGEYAANGLSVSASVTLARADAATFDSAMALAKAIVVSAGGLPCPPGDARFEDAPPDGVALRATYACPAPGLVKIDAAFVADLPFGHRHLAHATRAGGPPLDDVLLRDHHAFTFAAGADGPDARRPAALEEGAAMVRMGVEHILSGWDHLLFLLALVLACTTARAVLGAVTAFTVAHSVTLAVAVLGPWAPPASIVEPLIAASIAYVAALNLAARAGRRRWHLTFPFGLVHGFGFAGALREVHVARASVPFVLGAFNVGVEIGQLLVLAAVVPVVFALRRRDRIGAGGLRALNGAVALTGVVWTLVRVFGRNT
ncbi:MAG TPA: HupE/UreJ family protein [Polyangiaceae bacterium]|jgi:hypothetical protein|nr:HupE/UreJ family protein [Polyangiaceae bacterium]